MTLYDRTIYIVKNTEKKKIYARQETKAKEGTDKDYVHALEQHFHNQHYFHYYYYYIYIADLLKVQVMAYLSDI